jgi:hypothetical protein
MGHENRKQRGQELVNGRLAVGMIGFIHDRAVEEQNEKTPKVEKLPLAYFGPRHGASP